MIGLGKCPRKRKSAWMPRSDASAFERHMNVPPGACAGRSVFRGHLPWPIMYNLLRYLGAAIAQARELVAQRARADAEFFRGFLAAALELAQGFEDDLGFAVA